MNKLKDYSSTIALIASFGVLIVSSLKEGIPELAGALIGAFICVLAGEVISIKNTGQTISKRFGEKSDNIKYSMSGLFILWAISLLVHLNI